MKIVNNVYDPHAVDRPFFDAAVQYAIESPQIEQAVREYAYGHITKESLALAIDHAVESYEESMENE